MKKRKKTLIVLLSILAVGVYLYWGNTAVQTSHFTYSNEKIPESFDDYKVVQVSDLHNTSFDGDLISKIRNEEPDIIVVTGDIIDRNRTDLGVAQDFLEQVIALAPVYFVSGNHEVASGKYPELQEILDEVGVTNLDNDNEVLTKGDEEINLLGLADPLTIFYEEIDEEGSEELVIKRNLTEVSEDTSDTAFNLLLSHRAELMEIYADSDVDLALTGHAHGGQIRLPIIGGLFSPSQGFFPKYTTGEYLENNTTMIVSRGLGNSIFPLRVLNRPELVVITLEAG